VVVVCAMSECDLLYISDAVMGKVISN